MVVMLTVKQLINKLKKIPQDYKIYTICDDITILDTNKQKIKHDIKTQIGSFEIDYDDGE
jgi:hypothetical protein